MGDLRVAVLSGLEATVDGVPADLGGPKQRSVLALLLLARGGIVPADRITEDLWRGEPPPRAAGALQAYVSHLRRALEPDRPPRAPAQVLVSASPGYAIRLPATQVDAWELEDLVRQGIRESAADPGSARQRLRAALRLWTGSPYAQFADEEWAAGEVTRLHDLHSDAVEHLADCELRLGQPVEALSVLERHAKAHPLRENAWALLATALYQTGRQADALAALRDLRRRLVDELGVDPGPEVQRLEAAILDHDESLQPRTASRAVTAPVRRQEPSPAAVGAAPAAPATPADHAGPGSDEVFVGRRRELGELTALAGRAVAGGVHVALIAGEPGAGKSTLAEELGRELAGWLPVWGRCPEVEGAPPLYPWSQLVRSLPGVLAQPDPDLAVLLDDRVTEGGGDAAARRFRLHRAVGRVLRSAAQQRPLLLVLDDVHRADDETLALLVDVLPDLADVPVVVTATYRPAESRPSLAAAFAALARHTPHRVELAGLTDDEAATLVRHASSADLPADVVEAIVARTDGNPFYVREAARLAGSSGATGADADGVPEGVRDVIGRRLARLPAAAHTLLRMASLQGRQVDVDLLLSVSDLDEDEALDGLDSALVAGLVEEPEPGALRFVHALVQETLYDEISLLRRARWHARLAEAIEALHPDDHAALAHHYRMAGPGRAPQVLRYAALAAEQADARHAYAAAAELWRQAIAAHGNTVDPDPRQLVELWIGLLRTLGHAAAGQEASEARREAVATALPLDDPVLTARAMTAWDTPMVWATHEYALEDRWLMDELLALVDRLAQLPQDAEVAELRCRLLAMYGMEMEGTGDTGAMASAREAAELAREIGDPELTTYALDGLSRQYMGNVGYAERLAAGQECLDVAVEHDLAGFQGLGHFFLEQAAAASGDLDAAVRHGEELARLGRTYGLPGLVVVSKQVPALVALARGDLDEARRRYREFGDALDGIGAFAVDALRWIAEWLVALQEDRVAATVDVAREATAAYPPLGPILVHTLLAAGERDEAAEVFARRPPPRRDLLWTMWAVLDAENTLELGTDDEVRHAYEQLQMGSGELAGAASGFFTIWPVDTTMARLARRLGLAEAARDHAAAAVGLARTVGNERWLREAEAEVQASV